jgi:fructokinase
MHKLPFAVNGNKQVCSGTGLVALDVVYGINPQVGPRIWAGGSCGNVLAILAYLGWHSIPVARLRHDSFARKLIDDLSQWEVDTSLICQEDTGATPIIIQKIISDGHGAPRHRFEFTCPNCQSWLPRFRPIRARDVDHIVDEMPQSSVFYLDRVTAGTLELARRNRERGALIVFEPSNIGDRRLFSKCLQITDILKYSHDRLGCYEELSRDINVTLQIETLGSEGLRYRRNKSNCQDNWKHIRSFSVSGVKDAAGSGDWCTAGLIHYLHVNERNELFDIHDKEIEEALYYGQALAALNCLYEGARGSMYGLSREVFADLVEKILSGNYPKEFDDMSEDSELPRASTEDICPSCSTL